MSGFSSDQWLSVLGLAQSERLADHNGRIQGQGLTKKHRKGWNKKRERYRGFSLISQSFTCLLLLPFPLSSPLSSSPLEEHLFCLRMRSIMARSPHESSFSFSRRWIVGKLNGGGGKGGGEGEEEEEITTISSTTNRALSSSCGGNEEAVLGGGAPTMGDAAEKKKKKLSSASAAAAAVTKFRSVLTAAMTGKSRPSKVTCTLFGHRRGHIHFAFQIDSKSLPTVLIELSMPTSTLVKEMASGLVRIALECERKGYSTASSGKLKPGRLLEETLWRAYCNGKKCGYAVRRELGPEDWKVLRSVEPVSMGAGVLPAMDGGGAEGEMMYMRAKFERVVGSKDSEAFYMMNPDGNSGPELSVYLLRV